MVTVVKVKVQCPECANKFYSKTVYGVCPHCGHEAEEPDDTVIPMPALRSATTKATDKVYRDMETASIHRAEEAARVAGVPVSEMSHLKITNLRDNVKEGETYAMPVNNPVTQQMEMMRQNGMQAGFVVGSSFAASVNQGYAPRAGAGVLDKINPNARGNKLGARFT
jgi:hypothetical protein